MNYIGIDLHKRIIVICVMNDKREVLNRIKFHNDEVEKMKEFFASKQPFQAAFEATASYEWFYTLLEPLAETVILVHPKKLRIIAESRMKSDKIDAQILAEFLAIDMLPKAHCPSPFIRGYRDLVRFRYKMQSRITLIKNQIRNVLSQSNQDRRNLFTLEGKVWLQKVKLKATHRYQIDRLLEELDLFTNHKKETEEAIKEYVKKAPHPVKEARDLVQTIPGVGVVTADVVVSELGDASRFSSQKDVCSYAGLVPGYRQSADREKRLPITKMGSRLLRWIMVEAAWTATQFSPKWKRIYESLYKQTKSKKKAIVAVARKLLCVMFALMRNGTSYSPTA